ncbi:MAG: hypothetical protein DCC55_40545 [Chloroflexi bacterium]|nr:MAG: hypothetical protein DCC55_40545 [Chloroflexota bacterium]
MWLITEYEAASLFSLKHSIATATGGTSLLTPTPFAVKMALLDTACRLDGLVEAKALWPSIRDLRIAVSLADYAVVTNLFQKVLRPRRNAVPPATPDAGPFQRTIGYREYVQLTGTFGLALEGELTEQIDRMTNLLLNVNYFGKRGGFVQLIATPQLTKELPDHFVDLGVEQTTFALDGVMQVLDDCAPSVSFDQVNIFGGGKLRTGTDRILRHIILPYRVERSSRGYTLYRRVD